jgi:hypothetical protein
MRSHDDIPANVGEEEGKEEEKEAVDGIDGGE